MNTNDINWQEIGRKLREPFNPDEVDFRPQGKPGNGGKVQAVAYIDARTVADRLDDVVGPGAWSFTYDPLVLGKDIMVAKGALTIYGVTKEDVGEASNFDPSKGCVSDALKRAAVLWGIGRYLYGIGGEWVTADNGRISDRDMQRMRGKLPRPQGKAPAQPTAPAPRQSEPPATPATSSPRHPTPDASKGEPQATEQQREAIHKLSNALGKLTPTESLTYAQARELISQLSDDYQRERRKEDVRP